MPIPTILTTTRDCSRAGRSWVVTTSGELYLDKGMIRTIKTITLETHGRSKTCHLETRILDRESGRYYPIPEPKELTYKEGNALLNTWLALPFSEAYKCGAGTIQGETRYLK